MKQNFDAQEAAALYQDAHLHTMEDLGDNGLYPNVISQLALRILTYEYPLEAILAIYYLCYRVPHDQWNEAVRWYGDTKLAATIQNEAEFADAKIILSKLEKVVVEAESRQGVVVWSSTQKCPTTIPWDISIRSDKEGQSIYGRRKLLISQACLEARRQYRLLHWVGAKLLMNSWCYITLDWTAPSIGMHFFASRVPQPVELLLWRCLEPQNAPRVVD